MNKSSVWCTIMAILGFIFGVGYCFTIILIPVAIYCFIGAKRYMEWANLTDSQLVVKKQSLINWAIFFSIVGFPLGLISIVPACMISNNNIVVTDVKTEAEDKDKAAASETETDNETKETVEEEELSDIETIEKLNNLKKEGLITEEEYARAKDEVLNKKK